MGVTRGSDRPRVSFRTGEVHSSEDEEDSPHHLLAQSDESTATEEASTSSASSASSPPPTPLSSTPVSRPPPPSPLFLRRRRRSLGQRQPWKKGRRARQRFDEERRLFAQFVDPEDEEEAFTIVRESNSHFRHLLEDKELLEVFVSEAEEVQAKKAGSRTRSQHRHQTDNVESPDPEAAYLGIAANIRLAMKRHLPLGMVENLEEDIRSFFMAKPNSVYIAGDLSSYERLLAHACCTYNRLSSRSFDDDGGGGGGGSRKLRVENPFPRFCPTDPCLSVYLQTRNRKEEPPAACA